MSGNSGGPTDDPQGMDRGTGAECGWCRDALSAALDGEAGPGERERAEVHLDGCAACRSWQRDAVLVTRRARTAVAEGGPDLVGGALEHLPGPRPRLLRPGALRVALLVVGAAQLVLGLVSLLGAALQAASDAAGGHGMTGAATHMGAGIAHVAHETAAWNLALGAAFLVGGLRPRHLAGLLPVLGVFLAVLAVLSGVDLVAGRVDVTRVVSHLLLVVGFVLGVLVVRAGPHRGPAPTPGARLPADAPGPPHRPVPASSTTRHADSTPDVA